MRNCTGKQILPIMLFVFAAFNLVSAQTLVGENIDYWYNYNAAPPGQKGGPGTGYSCFLSTEQYLGAVFLRDTTKPLIVSIDSRCHGAWYSDLYLMVPRAGLPDSALYLFNNYDPTGNTINLTNLGVHIRNLDTLYFRFNVTGFTMHGSPQSVRYTGPNRRAGDPQNWRRFDRYSSDDYSTQILAGQTYPAYRRWAVAGWLPDAAGNTTDTV